MVCAGPPGFSESTRRALEEAAYELIRRDGFEATPVAAIAERAGFTERTFFRCFGEKADVVFAPLESQFDDYLPHLRTRVGDQGLSVGSLVCAFTDANAAGGDRRELIVKSMELIRVNPVLERRLAYHQQWFAGRIVEAVTDIVGPSASRLSVTVTVGMAITITMSALRHWMDTDRRVPLDDLIDEARRRAEAAITGTGSLDAA